jgi:hypothetical protein
LTLQNKYSLLLSGLFDYLVSLSESEPAVLEYVDVLENWGTQWKDPVSRYLPVSDYLDLQFEIGSKESISVLGLFSRFRQDLNWEQSYSAEDNLVGKDMLNGYGFAEIVGKRGPFISESIRAGIAIWGPEINYPIHQHQADEIYSILDGSARFTVGDDASVWKCAGDNIFIPSNLPHGFSTADQALIVLYFWKGGDLRQRSSFNIGS